MKVQGAIQSGTTAPWIIKNAQFTSSEMPFVETTRILYHGPEVLVRLMKQQDRDAYFVLKSWRKDVMVTDNLGHLVRNERCILQSLSHPNIVKCFGTMTEKVAVSIAMEYVVGGTLASLLHTKATFGLAQARFYAAEMLSALHYLHAKRIVHRNIHPSNIAIDEDGHIRLLSFGSAKQLDSMDQRMTTMCGHPSYWPPEKLNGSRLSGGGYDYMVDFWAFGVLLYEMLTTKMPYEITPNDPPDLVYTRIMRKALKMPSKFFDADTKYLLSALLNVRYKYRLNNWQDVRGTRFFSSFGDINDPTTDMLVPMQPLVQTVGDYRHYPNCSQDVSAFFKPLSIPGLSGAFGDF